MTIRRTYSSWTRNRLHPELRDEIRAAGEGIVDFEPAVGKPRGWVGCRIETPDRTSWSCGRDPEAAFRGALAMLETEIVGMLP